MINIVKIFKAHLEDMANKNGVMVQQLCPCFEEVIAPLENSDLTLVELSLEESGLIDAKQVFIEELD